MTFVSATISCRNNPHTKSIPHFPVISWGMGVYILDTVSKSVSEIGQ